MGRSAEILALQRTVLLARDFVSLGVSDEDIVRALRTPEVALVANENNLRSQVGQSLLVTLAQLVVASGARLRLAFPEMSLAGPQPPIRGTVLRKGLVELLSDAMPGAHVTIGPPIRDDIVFAIGDSPAEREDELAWRVWARPWSGGISPISAQVPRCGGDWTTGASIAAPIAAAEVAKIAIRPLVSEANDVALEQLGVVSEAHLMLADRDDYPRILNLGRVDLVSGGAICSAALHSLVRHTSVFGRARVIEPDRLGLTNANRYPLMRLSQVGSLKTEALAGCSTESLAITGVPVRLEPSTLVGLRPFAPRVLVGVDDIPSRWVVQREWPEWLAVGGTVHFIAVVSDHRRGRGCAGCFHPRDDGVVADIPTIAFVSYLAGAALAGRLLLEACGLPSAPDARAVEMASLRLDLPGALWAHPVKPNASCPVHCATA